MHEVIESKRNANLKGAHQVEKIQEKLEKSIINLGVSYSELNEILKNFKLIKKNYN